MTTWIKVYNSMPSHPKVLMAGDRAAWLFVCGCCYSNEHLTDGFIARHVLPVVAPAIKNAEALAVRLVSARLWHTVEGGWQIHDYDEAQRSAEEIRGQRSRDAKRKADKRAVSVGSPRGQIADSTAGSARNPDGVRDVEQSRGEQRTEDVAIAPPSRRAPRTEQEKANEDDTRLCRLLAELAKQRNPKFKVKSQTAWLRSMRLIREQDDNQPVDTERLVRWLFTDTGRDAQFWADVIQSPANLREHYSQLWAKMTAGPVLRAVADVESSEAMLRRRGAA